MEEGEEELGSLSPPIIKARDNQGSPVAILTIALASGIGYLSWKLLKRWQDWSKDERDPHPAGLPPQDTTTKSRSKGSSFTFDKSAATANGRLAPAGPSSSTNNNTNTTRKPSRRDPKPKSQKQLRKEAKQAKKAAHKQAARDAESAALATTIAKRAKDLGLGQQPPEPQKQYYVDYEGVTQAYDKIVEWQQSGKKKF